jgi:hypothetical protein
LARFSGSNRAFIWGVIWMRSPLARVNTLLSSCWVHSKEERKRKGKGKGKDENGKEGGEQGGRRGV